MHRDEHPPRVPPADPRGDDKPSLPAIVANAFVRLDVGARARLLGRLLAPLGPSALAAAAGGAFAKYVTNNRLPLVPVTLEDAARATAAQVADVARAIQQTNPQLFERLLELLARDATTIAALSASIAALTLERVAAARRDRR
ncbi:MAG: hypothetical protein OEV46_03840 [Betaproteobacteria bacterium]|nr:hypothetical protein [Betaproteobacteria bacterium]MDH5285056.1 hypothetical protein [Betaproteobacteria bacterium]